MVKKRCRCGEWFSVAECVARYVALCLACRDAVAAADTLQRTEERDRRLAHVWAEVCPLGSEFRKTVRELLPHPATYDRVVVGWTYGAMGVVLHGQTGQGKSRIAWKLLERECARGRTVAALTATSGMDYAASYEHGATYAAKWLARFRRCELLLCDDIFKAKPTESYEAAVFGIASERMDRGKPIIWTLNDTGVTLERRLSPDRGPALMRRLREFNAVIGVGNKKEKS